MRADTPDECADVKFPVLASLPTAKFSIHDEHSSAFRAVKNNSLSFITSENLRKRESSESAFDVHFSSSARPCRIPALLDIISLKGQGVGQVYRAFAFIVLRSYLNRQFSVCQLTPPFLPRLAPKSASFLSPCSRKRNKIVPFEGDDG